MVHLGFVVDVRHCAAAEDEDEPAGVFLCLSCAPLYSIAFAGALLHRAVQEYAGILHAWCSGLRAFGLA